MLRYVRAESRGQEVAIFRQTLSILPLNSPKWRIFSQKFGIFGRTFLLTGRKFTDNQKLMAKLCPTTTPLRDGQT